MEKDTETAVFGNGPENGRCLRSDRCDQLLIARVGKSTPSGIRVLEPAVGAHSDQRVDFGGAWLIELVVDDAMICLLISYLICTLFLTKNLIIPC